MKCTNKLIGILITAALLVCSGCGADASALNAPYDVYQTTQNVGLSASETTASKTYFASDLCVAENVSIGTNSDVYAKNLFEKLYPASTTKILTAYIALKYCDDLDVLVTVSENAVDQASDSSVCNLKAGDVISMRDLLYGLMLRSGNDAAVAIAEYISGDVDSFAALMNQEAVAMGATRSHFANPNGLPDENHYTTVYDMYLIFNKALENETFVNIISAKSYDTVYTNAQGESEEHTWENTNQYLAGTTEAPEGFTVVGGKTGTTGDAGYCLVLYSYNAANQPIISIVFKADGRSNLYLLMNEMLAGYAN